MLYIAYIDEFGHIGPCLSPHDPRCNTHPVFDLGGLVLPYDTVREFSTFFYQLKNNLLQWEIGQSGIHPAKWEKKGSSLYTTKNVTAYPQLRRATNRLLNKIEKCGGVVSNSKLQSTGTFFSLSFSGEHALPVT